MTAESEMFAAVVYQAVLDADVHLRGANQTAGYKPQDGQEALKLLTDSYGPWARSRMDICNVCGMDPNALRDRVVAMIEEKGNLQDMIARCGMRFKGAAA